MTNLIIDLLLIGVLALCIWRGVTKGLILSVVGLLALLLSFYGARFVAQNYSETFVDALVPFVESVVDEKTTAEYVERGNLSGAAAKDEILEIAVNVLTDMGLSKEAAAPKAESAVQGITELGDDLRDAISDCFMETLAYIFTFTIAFILLNIILSVVLNLVNIMFTLPGLKILNTVGGAAAGMIYGLLMVFVIAWILRFTGFIIKPDVVERTIFLKWLIKSNPLPAVFGF